MIKKLGLTTIVLSALLLSGCGGGSNSSSSKSGDLIIDNDSIYGIGKVFIKKTSNTTYSINILTQPIAAGTEVALSTKICDTNIDIKIITTDNRAFYSRNKYLPCDGTFTLHIYNSSN